MTVRTPNVTLSDFYLKVLPGKPARKQCANCHPFFCAVTMVELEHADIILSAIYTGVQ
jgi:hypothetical protein